MEEAIAEKLTSVEEGLTTSGTQLQCKPEECTSVKVDTFDSVKAECAMLSLETRTSDGVDRIVSVMAEKKQMSGEETESYLELHNILGFMQSILTNLIKERPKDPYSFVGKEFSTHGEALMNDVESPNKAYSEADVEKFIIKTAKRTVAACEEQTEAMFRRHMETILQLKTTILRLMRRNKILETTLGADLPPVDEEEEGSEEEDEDEEEEPIYTEEEEDSDEYEDEDEELFSANVHIASDSWGDGEEGVS